MKNLRAIMIIFALIALPGLVFAGGTSTRSFSTGCYNSSVTFTVFVDVVPDTGTKSWACEDQPPSGWTVSNISDSGVWDNNYKKVKWFFLNDDSSRTLSYDLTPPASTTGTSNFTGRSSFDGPTVATGGDSAIDCCAPAISVHPSPATRCSGDSASFSVIATGNGTLSYQWKKDGSNLSNGGNISGADSATLTIDPVGTSDAGEYSCEVSDECGTTESNAAALTVQVAPSVTTHPSSDEVCSGDSAQFSVVASGTSPLSYQWKKDGSNLSNGGNISGADTATLTINPTGTGDAGDYTCEVSNNCGSDTSNAATLTVKTAPTVNLNPISQEACTGDSVQFTILASGTAPLSYQWKKDGSNLSDGGNISGATSNTLTINPVATADAGDYTCEVSNDCGTDTSNAATLTVKTPPSVTTHPTSQEICTDDSVQFTVAASGTTPLTYQWKKDGSNLSNGGSISGADTATLTIDPVATADAGDYTCEVTNDCGTDTSNAATLTVKIPPSITTHPSSKEACTGNSVHFTVAASGTTPLTYQWKKDGSNLSNGGSISGADTATLTINPVATADAGDYTCEVSNDCGTDTSNAATLTVNTPPSVTTHPTTQGACVGDSIQFTVAASGTTPLSYQWKKDGSNLSNGGSISGADTATLAIDPVATADAGDYTCEVTNDCGTDTSNAATLTVDEPLIDVTPTGTVDFGWVAIGNTLCREFIITNVGCGSFSGAATSDDSHFVVQEPSNYTLAQDESTSITVCYEPDGTTTDTATITFTGGGGTFRDVVGSGFYRHCADADGDMRIVADEITGYASDWKLGVHDCIQCVTHGAYIYLTSEKYKVVGPQDPDCCNNCDISILAPDLD